MYHWVKFFCVLYPFYHSIFLTYDVIQRSRQVYDYDSLTYSTVQRQRILRTRSNTKTFEHKCIRV